MKLKINLTVQAFDEDDNSRYFAKYLGEEGNTVDDAIAFLGTVERAIQREDHVFIKEDVSDASDNESFKCKTCGGSYRGTDTFLKHLRTYHNNGLNREGER